MFVEIKGKDTAVFTQKGDICAKCVNAPLDCPLVNALRTELVTPHYDEFEIRECGLFKGKHLKVIR